MTGIGGPASVRVTCSRACVLTSATAITIRTCGARKNWMPMATGPTLMITAGSGVRTRLISVATQTGHRIVTATGDGVVLTAGPGWATSRGAGLRITMAAGSITTTVGAGLRAPTATVMNETTGIRRLSPSSSYATRAIRI